MELVLPKPLYINEVDNFAVVLCGGGAAGRWQAGVLTALAQHFVLEKARVITGTSVGGLNAALFALFGHTISDKYKEEWDIPDPYLAAVDVWESITKNSDVYKGDLNSLLSKIGAGLGFLFGADCMLNPDPLYGLIEKTFENRTLEDIADVAGKHLIVSTMDLNLQMEEFFCSFDPNTMTIKAADALKCTSAIPAIFRSVPLRHPGHKNAHWHVDGGLAANNPFISLERYNATFPGAQIHKAVVVYCYPDATTDVGFANPSVNETASYKQMREATLRSLGASMSGQEQMAERWVEWMVEKTEWDVMALWPKKSPCDTLDFTKTEILREGYLYGIEGIGYDYRTKKEMSIADFLKTR